jgi:hypothetical protein
MLEDLEEPLPLPKCWQKGVVFQGWNKIFHLNYQPKLST